MKVKLHYLYYPYLLEVATEQSTKQDVIGLMFLRFFNDCMIQLTGLISLTYFFPFECVYLVIAFFVFWASLFNIEAAEDPIYLESEEDGFWKMAIQRDRMQTYPVAHRGCLPPGLQFCNFG